MFKEKTNQIVTAYAKLFGKESVNELEAEFNSFKDYASHVTYMEYKLPIANATMEPDDFRRLAMDLDRTRKIYHDAAISSCNILNKVCEMAHIEPFYTGDINDRHQVAQFIGDFVNEMYQHGIGEPIPQKNIVQNTVKAINMNEQILSAFQNGPGSPLPENFSMRAESNFLESYTLAYNVDGYDIDIATYYPQQNEMIMKNGYNDLESCIQDIANGSFDPYGTHDAQETNYEI